MNWRALSVVLALAWPALAQSQEVTAVLEPAQMVEIRPVVAGVLVDVSVREGAKVEEGAPLARLDARGQKERVALARAVAMATGRINRADAQIAQAQALLARMEAAQSRGAAQVWEVDQARQALTLAQADMQIAVDAQEQAKAQLRLEEAILRDYTLQAPFSGVVLEVQETAGASVDLRSAVMVLGDLKTLEATAFVPVDWLPKLAVGDVVDAEVLFQSDAAKVVVSSIDPRIDPASQTVRVRLALDNAAGLFSPGATLAMELP